MNDVRRIDEFLKLMANVAKRNFYFDADTVYGNLVNIGIENKKENISYNFDNWINHFKDVENINVFVSPSWKYFCQFKSKNRQDVKPYAMLKLYIPLNKEYIGKGAEKLFEFLSNENIQHVSKIGSHVRFDDIVVRVTSSNDADKIINFVNNDEYLKKGLLPANPFTKSSSGVSISWDGMISYNQVVSSWISDYINYEKNNGSLDMVSYSKFFAYVKSKYNSLFVNGAGLDELIEKLEKEDILDVCNDIEYQLLNYRDVSNLIINNLDLECEMTKEDIYDYVKNVSSPIYQSEQIEKISRLQNKKELVEFTEQQKSALKMAFNYMCERYGYSTAKCQFISFMSDGNYKLITGYKGARDLMIDNNITKEVASKIVVSWKEEALYSAMNTTYNKYGYTQLQSAVNELFVNDDVSRFTNDNNCRNELKRRFSDGFSKDVICEILKSNGYEVNMSDSEIVKLFLEVFFEKMNKKTMHM